MSCFNLDMLLVWIVINSYPPEKKDKASLQEIFPKAGQNTFRDNKKNNYYNPLQHYGSRPNRNNQNTLIFHIRCIRFLPDIRLLHDLLTSCFDSVLLPALKHHSIFKVTFATFKYIYFQSIRQLDHPIFWDNKCRR